MPLNISKHVYNHRNLLKGRKTFLRKSPQNSYIQTWQKYQKICGQSPQNFAEMHELPAGIPVLMEVKEYLFLGHSQNISKNQRINETKGVPLPRSAGGEGDQLCECC